MKKIITCSCFMVAYFLAASTAKGDLLYFMANAFDWDGPKLFDYASIGVAKGGDANWGDGGDKVYLNIYPSSEATTGTDAIQSDAERYRAVGWADVSDYTDGEYSFYLETYAIDGDEVDWANPIWSYGSETAKTYAQLVKANHVYVPGTTDPQDVTAWVVPEPTSGLLVLFGLAALALKRKTNKMKNSTLFTSTTLFPSSFLLFTFLLSPLATGAAVNDTLITFSTPGPDLYADGTTVLDGECYALVWTKTGAAFAGLAADGTAVGDESKVLVFAPLAKGGRCPATLFELDAELAKAYEGGSFGVYLVDTRLADGTLGGVNAASGLPVAVNGWGEGKSDEEVKGEGRSVVVTTKTAVPEGTPRPQITAIRIVGDNVLLTVKNTVPCLRYRGEAVRGEGRSAELSSDSVGTVVQGAADGEITIIMPKKGDSGLYSVGRE